MKVLIVDDEYLARGRLRRQLAECRDVTVVGEAATSEEAWAAVQDHHPQLLLLDISMPGEDGMSLAARLRDLPQPPAVVFTTAYEEHALSAYEQAALDYLVKPVRLERLREALARARNYCSAREAQPRWIRSRVGGRTQLIALTDVICCVAEDKYTTLYYHQDDNHCGQTVIDHSLAKLEQEYAEYFFRIHRSILVARQRLLSLDRRQGKHFVSLRGADQQWEVSRRHLPELRRFLKEHS